MAFPSEREIKVLKRPESRAQLQTTQSGWFQILFGPVDSLDGFMFWGREDNLKLGTPEGDKFGSLLSAFLEDELKPRRSSAHRNLSSRRECRSSPPPDLPGPGRRLAVEDGALGSRCA